MSVHPAPVRRSSVSTAKVQTMWPPSYHKQGSNLSEGQILHLGPLRQNSRQVHKVSPLETSASSSTVLTTVPLVPNMFFKEASLLGNAFFLPKHVGGVSSVSRSASVTSVRDVPVVVTSPPVGGRLQVPFGLSTTPMEFTIVVKEVKLMAQAKGIQLHQYLDNWLIRSQTKESCAYQTQALLTLLSGTRLGRESSQVRNGPKTGLRLCESPVRPEPRSSPTHSSEMADRERQDTLSPRKAILLSKAVHVPYRSPDSNRKTGAVRKITHETLSVAPQTELAHPRISREKHSNSNVHDNVLLGQPLHPLQHALQLFTDASREGWGA